MTETDLANSILIELGKRPEVFIWKHPTGVARAYSSQHIITYGLIGSPDLIGAVGLTIQPEHIGRRLPISIGIEVKLPRGVQSADQVRFQKAWERRVSGLYTISRSVKDAVAFIDSIL